MLRFRRSELFFSAYFVYVIGVALFRPIAPDIRTLVVTLNLALIMWFVLFAWANKQRGFLLLDHVRDFYPLPLILLAFREMGWMALPHTSRAFELYWVRWDRVLLADWGLGRAIESLGPVLPNLLELSYLLVYGIPVYVVAVFYHHRRRERLDDAYSILLFGTLTTYALYPLFPSEPPRSVFPTADLPMMSALRQLNLWIVGGYGIHTSVFPSGHSAAAFSAAFAVIKLLPEKPWPGRNLLILATLIAVATVYGRYHYAVDTVAGLSMALLALAVSAAWRRRE
ncbi:phosphatase PAP2 family protein [uncultured Paludibaculum sp.]|uniref:phosphatase PAP2 family protein n=1 Tax=uncultured Paludibaculum sp. TaxID=1765020 RepID=UPI002AAAF6D7|nr:phosphatase PAP2 family protein [uncultured Paludibaculum sp.]